MEIDKSVEMATITSATW